MRFLKNSFKSLTGFRWERVTEWQRVVAEESRRVSLAVIVREILGRVLTGGRVEKTAYKRRIRVCRGCPVFDQRRKTCRPFPGSPVGCGCYMPFKALIRENACWVRAVAPDSGLGFE